MSAPVCKLPPNSLTSFDLDCPCAKCSATRTYLHDKHLGTPTAITDAIKARGTP